MFLGLFPNIWVIFFIQIIFGFVIPISSSCEYAFIFNHSDNSNRAESLALYSNTLKGAAISGIFLGGFFFESISASNTFIIAGFFILVCLLYIGLLIPNLRRKDTLKIANSFLKLKSLNFKDLKVFLNVKFLLMMLLVALPIGILQEGVFLFGIPIILSHFHVREVLIGEVMVLFSLGYFATNKYISKKADKNKKELTYIFWGLLGISISLIVMSIILRGSLLMLGFGLFLLGVFRGFIYSPSISVVSKSTVARITGKNVSLSVFRLFEMVGRILGPLLVGLLLIFDDSSLGTFIFIAFIMLLCAFVFKVFMKKNLK